MKGKGEPANSEVVIVMIRDRVAPFTRPGANITVRDYRRYLVNGGLTQMSQCFTPVNQPTIALRNVNNWCFCGCSNWVQRFGGQWTHVVTCHPMGEEHISLHFSLNMTQRWRRLVTPAGVWNWHIWILFGVLPSCCPSYSQHHASYSLTAASSAHMREREIRVYKFIQKWIKVGFTTSRYCSFGHSNDLIESRQSAMIWVYGGTTWLYSHVCAVITDRPYTY